MTYFYTKTNPPNLDILETVILASMIANTYNHFRWDETDKQLKVYLNRELNLEEKIILDEMVSSI
jgi:hypothetical protein